MQAYVSTIPGVSQFAMRKGQQDIGATKANHILIWDKLADSTNIFLTGNTSTIYTWTYTDLGIAGPDKGKGGKYLILPPRIRR